PPVHWHRKNLHPPRVAACAHRDDIEIHVVLKTISQSGEFIGRLVISQSEVVMAIEENSVRHRLLRTCDTRVIECIEGIAQDREQPPIGLRWHCGRQSKHVEFVRYGPAFAGARIETRIIGQEQYEGSQLVVEACDLNAQLHGRYNPRVVEVASIDDPIDCSLACAYHIAVGGYDGKAGTVCDGSAQPDIATLDARRLQPGFPVALRTGA